MPVSLPPQRYAEKDDCDTPNDLIFPLLASDTFNWHLVKAWNSGGVVLT